MLPSYFYTQQHQFLLTEETVMPGSLTLGVANYSIRFFCILASELMDYPPFGSTHNLHISSHITLPVDHAIIHKSHLRSEQGHPVMGLQHPTSLC